MGSPGADSMLAGREGRPASAWSSGSQILALKEVPLFQAVTTRHLRKVAGIARVGHYYASPVVRAGTRGDAFHVILEGRAEVRTPDGRTRLLEAGDSFGELALLDGAPRAATVVAVGELTTAQIPRPAFLKLLRQEPSIALGIARGLVALFRELQPEEGLGPRVAESEQTGGRGPGPSVSLGGSTAMGWLEAMWDVPLFQSLSDRHLWRVIRLADLRRYPIGAVVVRAGTRGDAFHIILDGRVEVRPLGGRVTTLQTNDFFGELALLDGAPRAATVTAVDLLTTARIPRSAFLKLLKQEPVVAVGVAQGLVRMIRDLQPA
jgi:CRP-like cAMP-binding protein